MKKRGEKAMFHMRYATLEDKEFWFTLDERY